MISNFVNAFLEIFVELTDIDDILIVFVGSCWNICISKGSLREFIVFECFVFVLAEIFRSIFRVNVRNN